MYPTSNSFYYCRVGSCCSRCAELLYLWGASALLYRRFPLRFGCADFQHAVRQLVVECGKLKEQHPGLAIYPISRGRNWGYGSATPTSAGAVLLSLQDLNGAVEWVGNQLDEPGRPYGKRLGIVRVPANVTQQQLYDFLQESS